MTVFESSSNPKNGSVVIMRRRDDYSPALSMPASMKCNNSNTIDDFDEERGYIGHYSLDDDSLNMMNIPRSICDHTAYYCVVDDLRSIVDEAEEGDKVYEAYNADRKLRCEEI